MQLKNLQLLLEIFAILLVRKLDEANLALPLAEFGEGFFILY